MKVSYCCAISNGDKGHFEAPLPPAAGTRAMLDFEGVFEHIRLGICFEQKRYA